MQTDYMEYSLKQMGIQSIDRIGWWRQFESSHETNNTIRQEINTLRSVRKAMASMMRRDEMIDDGEGGE
jgi:hypothetical protein